MNKPLHEFVCDVCGKVISSPSEGMCVWKSDSRMRDYDFKIIHQGKCDDRSLSSSMHLGDMLGMRGLIDLTSQLSLGPIKKEAGDLSQPRVVDIDEYIDFVRRLQVPYYDEARQYFSRSEIQEQYSDANEILPYLPESLKFIIETMQA